MLTNSVVDNVFKNKPEVMKERLLESKSIISQNPIEYNRASRVSNHIPFKDENTRGS